MKCANCAAPLEIKQETKEFVCAYCGSLQIVDRSGGVLTLNLVTEAIEKVQQGADRTAAELALIRLTKKLNEVEMEIGFRPVQPNVARPPPEREGVSKALHQFWISRSFNARSDHIDSTLKRIDSSSYWKKYDDDLTQWNNNQSRRLQLIAEKSALEFEILFNESIVKRKR